MVYIYRYDDLVGSNYLNHTNKLSESWYSGKTGIDPLDKNIIIAFKYVQKGKFHFNFKTNI